MRRTLVGVLGGLAWLFSASALPSQRAPLQRSPTDRVEVNLGTVGAPVIPNRGQFDAPVRFASVTPTGNTLLFHAGSAIDLDLGAVGSTPALATRLRYEGANTGARLGAGDPLPGTATYITRMAGASSLVNLPTSAGVQVENLYPGVAVRHTVTGRQLISRYTLRGEAPRLVRLRFQGGARPALEPGTGNVRIQIPAGRGTRTVVLHPPKRLDESAAPAPRYRIAADSSIEMEVPRGERGGGLLVVETKLTFAPYFHEYAAVQGAAGEVVVVGRALGAMRRGAVGSAGDVSVTWLDGRTRQVRSTTFIVGSGAEVGNGVAAGPDGAVYVAGATMSGDFPLEAADGASPGRANQEGFLVRLQPGAGRVRGAYLGGPGNDAAHDVALTPAGTPVVAGTTGDGIRADRAGEMDVVTEFPVSERRPRRYFLAGLDSAATRIRGATRFDGPSLGQPVRVWFTGEAATPHVGVGNLAVATGWTLYTSQMSPWVPNSCAPAGGDDGWGWHAICWKALKVPTVPFNNVGVSPAWLPGTSAEGLVVKTYDNLKLDQIEANPAAFQSNPDGVWHENHYYTVSTTHPQMVAELAIGAAFYHECCGSPVYANYVHPVGSSSGTPYAMLISEVNLMILNDGANNPRTLPALCGTAWQSAGTGDMIDLPCRTYHSGEISFVSFRVTRWWFGEHMANDGSYETEIFNMSTPVPWLANTGLYVADPPEGQAYLASRIDEISAQLRNNVFAEASLRRTVYRQGQAVDVRTDRVRIRVVDFPD